MFLYCLVLKNPESRRFYPAERFSHSFVIFSIFANDLNLSALNVVKDINDM